MVLTEHALFETTKSTACIVPHATIYTERFCFPGVLDFICWIARALDGQLIPNYCPLRAGRKTDTQVHGIFSFCALITFRVEFLSAFCSFAFV